MFSILQKPQESVNAEDLETLQNEIEKRLADVVTRRWKLEQELDSLNNLSPDSSNQQLSYFSAISASTDSGAKSSHSTNSSQPGGKLRNSIRTANLATIDSIDVNSSDSTTTTTYLSNNGTNATHNTRHETDSVSSESSLTSNLTGSTIITASLAELGAAHQQSSSSTATNTNKRGLKSSTLDRPPKRFRPNNNPSLHSHTKRLPHMKQQRAKSEESRPLKKQVIKNEAPDKLWPFVDQFCATPNEDQIRDLEQMIKTLEKDREYYKLPNRQQNDDTNSNSNTSNQNKEKAPQRRKAKDNTLGALTQRVVSSFIEESEEDALLGAGDEPTPPVTKRTKSVGDVGNAKNFERKIRQQLEEYSILTPQDDIPFSSEEDEHSRQLRAYQHELLTIQAQNQHYMQILLKRAKKHIELEKEREKLRMASADVIAVYQRLIQAKQKKKSPSKKEKDSAWKALKIHESIFRKCDDLYLSNRLINGRRDFPDL